MPRWITLGLIAVLLMVSGLIVFAQEANAQVIEMANTLNVREAPTGAAAIIAELPGSTSVIVTGRTSTNRWYQIQTLDGAVSGWAASDFIQLNVGRSSIPIVNASGTTTSSTSTTSTTTTTTNTVPAGEPVGTGTVNVTLLNVRTAPNTSGAIIAEIANGTGVSVLARNSTSTWIQVQLGDGTVGWVFAAYLDLNVSISTLPATGRTVVTTVTNSDGSTSSTSSNVNVVVPAGDAPYFTLGANTANIFATGQAMGNRANVFSKIGDSVTVNEQAFRPFGFGVYNLGSYSYLEPTIDFFMAQARNNNSFNNTSLAAGNGYTTQTVLSSEFANPIVCLAGESPLACEYRLTRPAVALIMLGTNDTTMVNIDIFADNMRTITDYSIGQGVIPVLSTIPPRAEYPGRAEAYNQRIIDIAAERGLPLWDYYSAMISLPDAGLDEDGLHPSSPPRGFERAANFTGTNLQYGYVMRNLTALQALHVLRVSVLQ